MFRRATNYRTFTSANEKKPTMLLMTLATFICSVTAELSFPESIFPGIAATMGPEKARCHGNDYSINRRIYDSAKEPAKDRGTLLPNSFLTLAHQITSVSQGTIHAPPKSSQSLGLNNNACDWSAPNIGTVSTTSWVRLRFCI